MVLALITMGAMIVSQRVKADGYGSGTTSTSTTCSGSTDNSVSCNGEGETITEAINACFGDCGDKCSPQLDVFCTSCKPTSKCSCPKNVGTPECNIVSQDCVKLGTDGKPKVPLESVPGKTCTATGKVSPCKADCTPKEAKPKKSGVGSK